MEPIKNENIKDLIKIAQQQGLIVDVDFDEDEVTLDFEINLSNGDTYSFYVELSKNADAEEISDQLYMLSDSFYPEQSTEMHEEGYTLEDIDNVYAYVENLYMTHLAHMDGY